jgi:predicted kinase
MRRNRPDNSRDGRRRGFRGAAGERGNPGDFAVEGGAVIVVLVRRVRLTGVHAVQMVIFIGLPAAGKTTFFRQRFFETHVRISLDMLRTRHREQVLVAACLAARQPLVIDNTNVRRADRAGYIAAARAQGFSVCGYYFRADVDGCLRRNAERTDKTAIPTAGVLGKYKDLELPERGEGFDELYYVQTGLDGQFVVEEWRDEV